MKLYLPNLLYANHAVHPGMGLLVDENGRVAGLASRETVPPEAEVILLRGKALLPGLANAHSHTFQRLFRGRAEGRSVGGDSFWTWREQMYRAALFLTPDELYAVARAAFLEMICAGITVVGEFHYLHRDPEGRPYDDPNLLGKLVVEAAQSVGLRICLLRTAYFRAGFERQPHPGQRRFYESPEEYLRNLQQLAGAYSHVPDVTVGAAPHSIRAVPIPEMMQIAEFAYGRMPLHMHISEQIAENEACVAEYGMTPVHLLADKDILSPKATLVHAIHLSEAEFAAVSAAGAAICSCPTTERNLGDGIFPADTAFRLGIPVALGTDSQAQIDILEDARQLEYHLRLRERLRGILDTPEQPAAARLFRSATASGYAALGLDGGSLAPGQFADFFTVHLDDLSILGVDAASLAEQAVFALSKSAIRDVAVGGKLILHDGRHVLEEETRAGYLAAQRRLHP